MKVFFELWSDRKNAVGLHKHPLLQHLEPLGPIIEVDIGMGAVDGPDQHIYMDYFAMIFAYERVRLLHDPTDGWNGLEYFKHHFLLCDALDEMWRCHVMAPIEQQFHLLSLPCEPENQQEVQVQAREWVREVTTNSAIAKFNSSYWQPGIPYPLAKKWDEMPHRNADIASGTWAAYMRHASKYFTQERFKATSLKPVPINDEFGQVFVGELLVPISLAPKESLVAEGKRSDE